MDSSEDVLHSLLSAKVRYNHRIDSLLMF